jgi:hypothetical protein
VLEIGQPVQFSQCAIAQVIDIEAAKFGTIVAFSPVGEPIMKRALVTMVLALATLAPMTASAAVRGVFVVGGPAYYVPGWYSPFWGGYWGPGPYYTYQNSGEVKLDTKVKDAQVFINGAYAGTTKENKTMHLRPGSYNLEIREDGQTRFNEKVYVAVGKTLHLHPEL